MSKQFREVGKSVLGGAGVLHPIHMGSLQSMARNHPDTPALGTESEIRNVMTSAGHPACPARSVSGAGMLAYVLRGRGPSAG